MANELNFYGNTDQTGLTVTARVYDATGSQVGSDINCNDNGASAIYIGNMPSASLGKYGVRFFEGVNLLGQGQINWDGSKETELNLDVLVSSISSGGGSSYDDTILIGKVGAIDTKVSNLNDFDPATQPVIASNMRGTYDALPAGAYTAPDNSTIAQIKAEVDKGTPEREALRNHVTAASQF